MCNQKYPEFDIKNFKVGENYVIEASAGTGKTYTIVEIVKKLLANNVPLNKMLIVTYTEKAAGELKHRIRSGLAELSDEIRNNTDNDVDTASIGTIHSFCQKTTDEFFISAGKPSCQTLIDEEKINEFLKRYIRKGDIYTDICNFKKIKVSEAIEDTLIKKLSNYIKKYYLNDSFCEEPSVIAFDKETKEEYSKDGFWAKWLVGDWKNDPTTQKHLEVLKNSSYQGGKPKEYKLQKLYTEIQNSEDFSYNGSYSKATKSWSIEESAAYDYVKGKRDKIKNELTNTIINYLTHKYLGDVYSSWQKEKENLCEQTYNDMIRTIREEVCKGGALLNKIKENYTYAIIDEFQDTNQLQWDIFSKAFLSDGHNIIVVGDPKQSIYAFQGADVTVYNKAKGSFDEKHIQKLSCNHRATANIIDSTNNFFGNASSLPKNIQFEPSTASDKKFDIKYKGDVIPAFWITEEEVTQEEYARIVCNRIVDFCSVSSEGKETNLQIWDKNGVQRNVSFKDFAVLARTRSEMIEIKSAFEKCGIPYTQYKDDKLFSGKECANWIAVLEAINVPDFTGKNRVYFRKAMVTRFFGYTIDEIKSFDFDKDSTAEIKQFNKWREFAQKRKWAQLIERIISDTCIAEKMQELGDVKSFGAMNQIGEYCVDTLLKTDNIDLLIQKLRNMTACESDDDENGENLGTVAKSTDIDCVQIMTIHASKGLEFPIVISVAGEKQLNTKNRVYSYHENDNSYLRFDSNGTYADENVNEIKRLFYVAYTRAKYLLILPQYSEKKDLEFITNTIKDYKDKYNYMQLPLQEDTKLLEELKPFVKSICDRLSVKEESITQDSYDEKIAEIKDLRKLIYFHTSRKYAYSSLSHGYKPKDNPDDELEDETENEQDISQIQDGHLKVNNESKPNSEGISEYDKTPIVIKSNYTSDNPIELSPNFIAGTGLGNALHRIFQYIDYQKDNTDIDDLIIKCFAEEKITCKPEWITDVKNMVKNVLNAKLPVIHGNQNDGAAFSLREIDFDNRKNEVEFNYNIKDDYFKNYMNGFVDLIFKRGEYYAVLDWKSDRLSGDFSQYNDGDIMKQHVDELYSIQRVLYSYSLIKWLKQFYSDKTEEEIFNDHFGGIYYVFLRGCNENSGNGIYAQTWNSFGELETEYNKIIKERAHL